MKERTPEQAYLNLQKLAREQGHNTQQLFELYIHERFLARLAASRFAEQFILKGGMLLAVLDLRRGTRDADMLVRGVASDEGNLRAVIGEIAAVPMPDGVSFDVAAISVRPSAKVATMRVFESRFQRAWEELHSSSESICLSVIRSTPKRSTTRRSWMIKTSGFWAIRWKVSSPRRPTR